MRFLSLLSLLVLAAALGCAPGAPELKRTRVDHKHGDFTKHYAESEFATSRNKAYSVELIVLDGTLKKGENKVDLIIHDRNDADVMGAAVEVTPWMPDMGHGAFETPVVIERGGGLYSVENLVLSMGGRWEIRVKIAAEGGEDEAVFLFPDVPDKVMTHGHRGRKTMRRPAAIDTGTSVLSETGIFRVRYRPESGPEVPINRVQKWILHVERPDGSPVTDAEVAIHGEMPEHGHGMPTRPRVTRNLGNGDYLVDGLKFQMPGWWVVGFEIRSGGKTDTAAFNLDLK